MEFCWTISSYYGTIEADNLCIIIRILISNLNWNFPFTRKHAHPSNIETPTNVSNYMTKNIRIIPSFRETGRMFFERWDASLAKSTKSSSESFQFDRESDVFYQRFSWIIANNSVITGYVSFCAVSNKLLLFNSMHIIVNKRISVKEL